MATSKERWSAMRRALGWDVPLSDLPADIAVSRIARSLWRAQDEMLARTSPDSVLGAAARGLEDAGLVAIDHRFIRDAEIDTRTQEEKARDNGLLPPRPSEVRWERRESIKPADLEWNERAAARVPEGITSVIDLRSHANAGDTLNLTGVIPRHLPAGRYVMSLTRIPD